MSTEGTRLDHLLARNIRAQLEQRGLRQSELAAVMAAFGFGWTSNTVAQVLTLRRALTLLEMSALCGVFELGITGLLAGEDAVALPNGGTISLAGVRAALEDGRSVASRPTSRSTLVYVPDDEEERVARRLGVSIGDLHRAADRAFGTRDVIAERDRRAGDLSGLSKRSAQAKRGHVMRGVLADLAPHLPRERT